MESSQQPSHSFDEAALSPGARDELTKLGILTTEGAAKAPPARTVLPSGFERRAILVPEVLNDARQYGSSFSRGLRLECGGMTVLLISGTASIDEGGRTVHVGDFAGQCLRTYRNIAALLAAEGATWHDVVRTTCYLRDIARDYEEFNRIRTAFFDWMGLCPLPASVGVQARLCRDELLIEIEAIALVPRANDATTVSSTRPLG
ncbi:MAG: hypothetical protein JW751_23890 [Polyangiaceae bacterium]|nr:hypothetical protein [Polyangiaceae bacterium]